MSINKEKSYSLSYNDLFKEKNLVYHVKLTDSSLKAIESSISSSSKESPSIFFSGNEGHIRIPQQGSDKKYTFNIAPINEDTLGSYDCIRLDKKSHMHGLAKMTQKLTVHANEEVFSSTRDKFNHFEDEQRKKSTKVLKSSNGAAMKKGSLSTAARINKLNHLTSPTKRKKQMIPAPSAAGMTASLGSGKPRLSQPLTTNKKTTPEASHQDEMSSLSLKDRLIHLLAVRAYKKPELLLRLIKDGVTPTERASLDDTVRDLATQDRSGAFSLRADLYPRVQDSWAFYTAEDRALLKERRSHASGAGSRTVTKEQQPGNKWSRAAGMGVGEKSSRSPPRAPFAPHALDTKIKALDMLDEGLTPLAVSLRMHLNEKFILKWRDDSTSLRQLQLRKRGMVPATIPPPSPPKPPQPQPTSPPKRPHTEPPKRAQLDPPSPPKRAHIEAPPHPPKRPYQDAQSPPKTNHWQQASMTRVAHDNGSSASTNSVTPSSSGTTPSPAYSPPVERERSSVLLPPPRPLAPPAPPVAEKENTDLLFANDSMPEAPNTVAERDVLKQSFNTIYPEYTRLFHEINTKSHEITKYDERLKSIDGNTDEYKRICTAIINMYNEVKQPDYKNLTKKLQFLHRKLQRIKVLVKEFDAMH